MSRTSNKLFKMKNSNLKRKYDDINVYNDDKILLLTEPSEYDEVFRTLNAPSQKDFIEETLKDEKELNVYQEQYGNLETYKGAYIKKMCNKYFLYILPLYELSAFLSHDAIKAIKEFTTKFNKPLIDNHFQILAPREYFNESYRGKECKTFIIFYKPNDDSSSHRNYKVQTDTILIQIYSSGNDFSDTRLWLKHLDGKIYSDADSIFSKLSSNIIISLFLVGAIISIIISDKLSPAITFLVLYIIFTVSNTVTFESKKYWNKKP